jgi:hypothetical protein
VLVRERNAGERSRHGHHRDSDSCRYLRLSVVTEPTTPCGPLPGVHVFTTSEVRRDAPVMKGSDTGWTAKELLRKDYMFVMFTDYL